MMEKCCERLEMSRKWRMKYYMGGRKVQNLGTDGVQWNMHRETCVSYFATK